MEDRSLKIKKTRNTKDGERNHICGCGKAYKSYPALYLHIQRKHNGETPDNTVKNETTKSKPTVRPHTGRPPRADNDIDNIPKSQEDFEKSQNDLMLFLGEEISAIYPMDAKKDLKDVHNDLVLKLERINPEMSSYYDKEMDKIVKSQINEINIDDVMKDFKSADQALSAIVLWLGRYYIDREYLVDIAFMLYKMREYIKTQEIEFGTNKGFMTLELKESQANIEGQCKKGFKKDWSNQYAKAVRLFAEFLKCAFVKDN